jgi:hypothetical protein
MIEFEQRKFAASLDRRRGEQQALSAAATFGARAMKTFDVATRDLLPD